MNVIRQHKNLAIGVIGDIHGEFDVIREKVKYYNLENMILFQAGDLGVGFRYNDPRQPEKEKRRLEEINIFLKKRKIFLYVVRGNHDNPIFFDGNHNFTNIVFMQDYDIVEIGERAVLGIGGATCVDRKPNHNFKDYRGHNYPGRKEGIDWWPGAEKVIYDEEKLKTIAGIDIVVTHTAPDFVYPPVLGGTVFKWIECDPELKEELIAERELVGKIYKKLDEINVIKWWIYAHFHQSKFQLYNFTKFKLLDIGEVYEIKAERDEE